MPQHPQIKVALTTLGCKVNQFESASFLSALEDRGVTIVPFSHKADIYIINTCAVTAKAGAQSRQLIRKALKTNPDARLVVTGCYAQVASQDVLEIGEWSLCIVGNGFKHRLVDIVLSNKQCDLEMHMGDIGRRKEICLLPVRRFQGRTRAFLKLQDGCDNFCTYCIVPYARGRSRSLSLQAALDQVEVFANEGYREIVFTGIHLGIYGLDLSPQTSLLTFFDQATAAYPGIRFRLSSLEPGEVNDDIINLMAQRPNFMPHFHIPLQSGDDIILQEMNRHYQAKDFTTLIEKLHSLIPHAAIGIDVLVGFPGESDQAYENTFSLLNSLPVTYLHVFPYSNRPGTLASRLGQQIQGQVKNERVARLRELDGQKKIVFYQKHLGTTQQVLTENNKNRFKLMQGFTENYIPVHFSAPPSTKNTIVTVRLDRMEDGIVFGEETNKS